MSVILVVETDASYAQRISEALQAVGWAVEVCESSEAAAVRAAVRPPSLIVASAAIPDVRSLLGRFARAQGGPGSVALIPTTLVGRITARDYHADAILPKPFTADEARRVLLPLLVAEDGRHPQFSSADIFGEVLAEVEGLAPEPPASRPAPQKRPLSTSSEIDRKLEETLSGVFPSSMPRRASGAGPRPKRTSTEDIEELLDKTLSSLDLPRKKKRPAPPTAEAPTAPTAAPPQAEAPTAQAPPAQAPPAQAPPAQAPPAQAPPAQAPPAQAPPAETVPQPSIFEPPPPLDVPPLPSLPEVPSPPAGEPGVAEPPSAEPPPAPAPPAPSPPPPPVPVAIDEYRTQRLTLVPQRETSEGEIFGDYTLIRRIAVGGMAEVWQARRRGVEGFQKTVAIKKILSHLTGSSDFVSMFIDEAKLAAQLNHNNIIQIYDLGKVDEDFFIAMEHVDGMDVRTLLGHAQRKRRPLPMRLALLVASSVARALDYAHRKRDFDNQALGLVHRDVSPQNILISFEGEIKLCDFGIVKAVAKASTTQMGALKGKLQYMSPEQAWGKTVDARSDVFSLGSVLFEMLTGTRLFTGDSEIGVLDAVRECRVRSPRELVPEIPEEVDRIVRRALAKNPEERYQTAGEMEEDLKDVIVSLKPMPSAGEVATYLEELAAASELDGTGVDETSRPAAALRPAPGQAPETAVPEPAEPAVAAAPPSPADPDVAAPPTAVPPPEAVPPGQAKRRGGVFVRLLIAAVVIAAVSAAVFFFVKTVRDEPATAPVPRAAPTPAEVPATDSEGEAAAGSAEDLPATAGDDAPEVDIEGLVDEELARQRQEIEKKLQEELGAQKRQLERELEAARKAAEAARNDGGG